MYEHDALLALGFKSDEKPTKQAITKAYRAAALKYHPDKLSFPDSATETDKEVIKAEQKECFEEISMAYDYFLHPEKPEHRKGGAGRDLSGMTHHEFMSRQFGYIYTCQFGQIYGDKSQKYNIGFDCYQQTKDLQPDPESLNTDYFYFDTNQELISFCTFLESKYSHRIDLTSTKIPHGADKLLVDAIEKNRHIMEVKIFENFLSPEQHQRLKDIMHEKNYPNRLKASRKKVLDSTVRNASWLGALIGPLFTFSSLGVFCAAIAHSLFGLSSITYGFVCAASMLSAGGYYLGSIVGKLRYKHLDRAVDECYINEDTTNATTLPEIEALKAGVMAEKWTGYFSSFTNGVAYKHPIYFAAGMKVALDEDEKALPKLKVL
tara:strand:- start:19306 stop:20436 length:1131 start_codon:yes stop_codon:yes gene_type:complete